jgi:hypothetical protein
VCWYSVFHRFRQPKFAYCGEILNSSQFLFLFQLPQNLMLVTKMIKNESNFALLIYIRETHAVLVRVSMLEKKDGCSAHYLITLLVVLVQPCSNFLFSFFLSWKDVRANSITGTFNRKRKVFSPRRK